MKRFVAFILALSMAFALCGCGKSANAEKADELINAIGEVTLESKTAIDEAQQFYSDLSDKEKEEVENYTILENAIAEYTEIEDAYQKDLILTELTEEKWINVNDGDAYLLNKDGTGTHDGTKLSFSLNENQVSIVEGTASVQEKRFVWDREGKYPRLIPENENVFYVRESDYEEIGEEIKGENIKILLSQEFWGASTATAFYSFLENGYGWLVMTGTTLSFSWEMVDNNTVKLHLDYNGGQNSTLDIINDNGNYSLVAPDGSVVWTPYAN